MWTDDDSNYMRAAIDEAMRAEEAGDVPVGAVIVKDGEIVGRGRNSKEADVSAVRHAEINAIEDASRRLDDWRLDGARLYVTMEPCIMCAGAIIHARLAEVVFGCREPKFGGVISRTNALDVPGLNHRILWREGLMADDIAAMMKSFFRKLRSR